MTGQTPRNIGAEGGNASPPQGSGSEDSSARWGVVVGFTEVVVELNDGSVVNVPGGGFSTGDLARVSMGSIIEVSEDGTAKLPEPDYATAEELRDEEMRADDFLNRHHVTTD